MKTLKIHNGDIYSIEFYKDINILLGDLDLSNLFLRNLRDVPKEIYGTLNVYNNRINSFHKGPTYVKKLNISKNRLSNLDFCPYIEEELYLDYNNIHSLKNTPQNINVLSIRNNSLISLEYCPNNLKSLIVASNNIEFIGEKLKNINHINLNFNKLTNLKGLEKIKNIEHLSILNNNITCLKYLPKNIGFLSLSKNRLHNLKTLDNDVSIRELYLEYNPLTCLENLPKTLKLNLNNTNITSLENIETEELLIYSCEKIVNLKHCPDNLIEDIYVFNNLEGEEIFINSKDYVKDVDNYYSNLLNFYIKNNLKISNVKTWPENFISKNIEKNIEKSNKFNI